MRKLRVALWDKKRIAKETGKLKRSLVMRRWEVRRIFPISKTGQHRINCKRLCSHRPTPQRIPSIQLVVVTCHSRTWSGAQTVRREKRYYLPLRSRSQTAHLPQASPPLRFLLSRRQRSKEFTVWRRLMKKVSGKEWAKRIENKEIRGPKKVILRRVKIQILRTPRKYKKERRVR